MLYVSLEELGENDAEALSHIDAFACCALQYANVMEIHNRVRVVRNSLIPPLRTT